LRQAFLSTFHAIKSPYQVGILLVSLDLVILSVIKFINLFVFSEPFFYYLLLFTFLRAVTSWVKKVEFILKLEAHSHSSTFICAYYYIGFWFLKSY
jgi:hypothetical protein